MGEKILGVIITEEKDLKGVTFVLDRYLAEGGDGSAFGITVRVRCQCGKHVVTEGISWKNGPPGIAIHHVSEDQFGQEFLNVSAALDYLAPYVKECPICGK